MEKLTVYFKKNIVHSYLLEAAKVHVGRDESNDLVINSPEFAPVHAVIVTHGEWRTIRQLNDDFPLVINRKNTKEVKLLHGDTISAGHYNVIYSTNEINNNIRQPNKPVASKTKADHIPHIASFQIISGINIGKLFYLSEPMTMLGEHGSGLIVISKRKEGYFVSTLENTGIITLNNQPLDDKIIKLNHRDVLIVNNMTIQLYFD